MMRSLALLALGTAALWLLLLFPVRLAFGDRAVLETAVAAVLCLIPMALTMAWSAWAQAGSPETQLAAVLGGTALRMLLIVAIALALFKTVEELSRPDFLIWVVVFYLATLTLEIVLLVRRQAAETRTASRPHA